MSSTARKPSARLSPSGSSIRSWWAPGARIAPFAIFIAFVAIQPLVDERWLVVARGLVVGAVLAFLWRQYSELRESMRLRDWGISIAAGAAVFVAWIFLDHGWMVMGESKPFVPLRADGSLDLTLVALRLVGLVAVVPIMEELFWRSFLMRWIDKRDFLAADPRRTTFLAIAVSSAIFATAHTQWLAGLLAGAVYAGLFVGIGNLRASIASHATTNTLLGGWILATRNWSFW